MLAIGICGRQRALILVGYWTIGFSSLTSSFSHFSLFFSSFFFLFLLSFYTTITFPFHPFFAHFFFLHLSLTRSFMDTKLIKPSSPDVHPHVGENFKGKKTEVMASRTYKSDAPYENHARYSELRLLKNELPFDGIMNTLVWLGIDRSYLYSSPAGKTAVPFYVGLCTCCGKHISFSFFSMFRTVVHRPNDIWISRDTFIELWETFLIKIKKHFIEFILNHIRL